MLIDLTYNKTPKCFSEDEDDGSLRVERKSFCTRCNVVYSSSVRHTCIRFCEIDEVRYYCPTTDEEASPIKKKCSSRQGYMYIRVCKIKNHQYLFSIMTTLCINWGKWYHNVYPSLFFRAPPPTFFSSYFSLKTFKI